MTLNKLTALAQGNPSNSKGSDVANSVNALIDKRPTNLPTQFKDKLFVFCGDSTTEQAVANQGMFDRLIDFYSSNGMEFEGATGYVNYGSSGQTLEDFLTRVTPGFTGASEGNPAWNYEGVKPIGAVGLVDAVSTPDAQIYVVCYGINDLILDASLGNQTEDQIVNVLAPKLVSAVQRMQLARPEALIALRTPNAMTARPVNPAFPSPTEYPAWGDNLANDEALMLKWNNALERSYVRAEQELGESVLLIDTKRFSIYDRGVSVSADDRVELTDCVHPSSPGYSAMADGLAHALNNALPIKGPVALAKRQEASDATPAYSVYPEYVLDNEDLLDNKFTVPMVNSGATFIDLDIPQSAFINTIKDSPIYVYVANIGTLKFTSYNPLVLGHQTRIVGITVPVEFQVSGTDATVYQDSIIQPRFVAASSLESLRAYKVFDASTLEITEVKLHSGIAVPQALTFEAFNIRSNTRTSLGTVIMGANGFTATMNITPTTFEQGDTLEVELTNPASYTGDAMIRVEIA